MMMFNQSKLRPVWDHVHRTQPAPEQPEREVVAFSKSLQGRLPAGARLLDAGCGRGRNTRYLAQLGFAVYGCDLSLTAAKLAKSQIQSAGLVVDFQVADLSRLPYPGQLFSAAVCVHVLPYNLKAGIVNGLRELRRVLQPAGWLYFDLLDCDDAEYGRGIEIERNTFLDSDGVPIHFSSRLEIDELLIGFTVDRVARLELNSSGGARVAWSTACKATH
jgi:SAM-dependent methyltransferase